MTETGSDTLSRCRGSSRVLPEIIKSPADKRQYRAFTLSNKLTALVVSDPSTDKAAAALDVLVGSLNDPEELPGLAHYLEHMLFLGTEKHPEENAYAKYLAAHGGNSNAYTSGDNTCYYFDCSPDALDGALDIFAQFFISPLFTPSGSEREVNAVNSEHDGNVPDDECRKHRVDGLLSKKSHPYTKFGCGNKFTLWTRPSEQGIDVRSALLDFHRKNYSANLMKLVVIGKESCAELQKMVETCFEDVKNFDIDTPRWNEAPYGPDEVQTRIDLLPVMDIRELVLMFPVPDQTHFYKSGNFSYIKSLIGHEGPGSFLSLLKKKNWSTGVTSWSDAPGRGFAFIALDIELTPQGLEHVDDIVCHFFQYIAMLQQQGPQQWYWDEIRQTKEVFFRYQEDTSASNLVTELADQMANYPVEEVWSSRYILSDYQPKLITSILNLLSPENFRMIVQTKENATKVTDKEQYFGAQYLYSKIDPGAIESWKVCGLHPDLAFPKPNEYIPTSFDLKPRDRETGISPRIVLDDELSRVWFYQDNEFLLPRGQIILDILNSCARESPRNYNLQYLLASVVEDLLAEDCYAARKAGLHYGITASMTGMRIHVQGYDHKLGTLFDRILQFFLNLESAGNRFEDIKEAYVRDLRNWKDEEPSVHASDYLEYLVANKLYLNDDLLGALDGLSPSALMAYARKFFASVKLQWQIYGNFTEKEALAIHAKGVEQFYKFGSKSIFSAQLEPSREIELPLGSSHLYTTYHTTHSNSCTYVLLQFDMGGIHERAILKLIEQILSEPSFDILRTKEQLGYYVDCSFRRSRGVLGLEIVIQGEKHPTYLESRIENFLNLMASTIDSLTLEDFEEHQSSVIAAVSEKPKRLSSRCGVIDVEISRRTYDFDKQNKLVQELDKITLAETKKYFHSWIKPESSNRKKLTIHVISTAKGGAGSTEGNIAEVIPRPENQELISDYVAWKSSMGYYPAPKPCGNIPPWKTRSLACKTSSFY